MATPKKFQTLVPLKHLEGRFYEAFGSPSKMPSFEYLESPKSVRLEAWLVETMFGKDGEHIPHVECVTHTLIRVNRWHPEGEAEILFGQPYHQQDILDMIKSLSDHFRKQQGQKKASARRRRASSLQSR